MWLLHRCVCLGVVTIKHRRNVQFGWKKLHRTKASQRVFLKVDICLTKCDTSPFAFCLLFFTEKRRAKAKVLHNSENHSKSYGREEEEEEEIEEVLWEAASEGIRVSLQLWKQKHASTQLSRPLRVRSFSGPCRGWGSSFLTQPHQDQCGGGQCQRLQC